VYTLLRNIRFEIPPELPYEFATNNNTNTQDDIYSAVYTEPAICESSLWVIWTKVGQRQVAANLQAKLQT